MILNNPLIDRYYATLKYVHLKHKYKRKVYNKNILQNVVIYIIHIINTYNTAGVSRRQDQNVTNLVKNVNILEFGYYI